MDVRDRLTARSWAALAMFAAVSGGPVARAQPAPAPAAEAEAPAAESGEEPAQEPAAPGCGIELPGEITPETPCAVVGVQVMDRLRTDACVAPEPRPDAIEPPKPETLGAQGSPAQLGAAPSIATTPLAGGALGLGATGAGPRLVAALSVNFASALAEDSETLATTSRLSDLSIVVPFDTSRESGERPVDYIGVRGRVNLLAFSQGTRALEIAVDELEAALDTYADELAGVLEDFAIAMAEAPDRTACASALWRCASEDEVADACGQPLGGGWRDARAAADLARARVRREVDGNTLGLDLRADFGDPTLAGEHSLGESFSMLAAGAMNWRFLRGTRTTVNLRGRLGMAYRRSERRAANLESPTEFAVDWAVAMAATFVTGAASTELSFGLEGRERTSDTPRLPPEFAAGMEFVDLRIGVAVPLSENNSLGIGVVIPIDGREQRSPMLAVTGDWSVGLAAR